MEAHTLSIGNELVTGQQLDTNARWLSEALSDLGVRVLEHTTVGDDGRRIASTISRAHESAELVVLTGGLGPTPDDLTRQAMAMALDAPLESNEEALAEIRAFFERLGNTLTPSNETQAMIPRGCRPISNLHGTAPGIQHEGSSGAIFALPGVPREMEEMFATSVEPWVSARTAGATTQKALIRTFGISEARIGDLLRDLMGHDRTPLVGTTADRGVIGIRVIAYGPSEAEARSLIQADEQEIRRRLGDAVFGEGEATLESVVGSLLRKQGMTVATAESCTGGLLAKRLTDVPGSSAWFQCGYVTYSNEAKIELLGVPSDLIRSDGAVSEAVARAMASGCGTRSGCDFSISITGIAGPAGGSAPTKPVGLVFIGLADSRGIEVRKALLGDRLDRKEVRDRSCSIALNMLRLRLLGDGGM